jgi:hypothetical protein
VFPVRYELNFIYNLVESETWKGTLSNNTDVNVTLYASPTW